MAWIWSTIYFINMQNKTFRGISVRMMYCQAMNSKVLRCRQNRSCISHPRYHVKMIK